MFTPFQDDGRLAATPLPPMIRVRRRFDAPRVTDIPAAVRAACRQAGLPERIQPGMTIALGIGSRGIRRLDELAIATVRALQELGAEVFVVPAMGSHGAATAEGQKDVLARLGASETALGVPVRATMEVDLLGTVDPDIPVYMDRNAHGADGVVVLGRTKPHTDFHGPIESGAAKMVAVGLGKREGAEAMHSLGSEAMRDLIPRAAKLAIQAGKVLGAIEVVENAEDEPAMIVGLAATEIGGPAEERLLARAKELLGRLPFKALDVLVVDYLGKNISGSGMDTNVLGRMMIQHVAEPAEPRITVVTVLNLTEEAHGNAFGIGLADLTTWKTWQKIDLQTFYVNTMTAGLTGVQRAKLPMAMPDDRTAVAAALRICGRTDPAEARVARIRDTLHMTEFFASESALAEADPEARLERISEPEPWGFDANGSLAW
ncbi:MAG TPA: lactate racemase domain-containing protein [Chloroflexota bacterium]